MRKVIFLVVILPAAGLGYLAVRLGGLAFGPELSPPRAESTPAQGVETVADGLEIPWEVAFAPDGRMFITERPGRVRVVRDGTLQAEPVLTVNVPRRGEGGLQGLALDPGFRENKLAYLYYSYLDGRQLLNRVQRYRDEGIRWVPEAVLLEGIPGNNNHNGGRLAFGPDGKLYVTTGDSQEPSLSQDRNSLAGKILRLNSDGSVPADNPFGNFVWSYGHRNPQGLAWDDERRLYSTEHGPSGDLGLCCRDEVNRIERGGNYGWPLVTDDGTRDGTIPPLIASGTSTTWAPGGLAHLGGRLYFAALRGVALYELDPNRENPAARAVLTDYGRLRSVIAGPDGALYVATSNRDGRGQVRSGDDKILRIRF